MAFLKNPAVRSNLFRTLRIVVTVVLLTWVLSRAGLREVFETLRGANLWLMGLAALFLHSGVLVRSIRWMLLLRGSGVHSRFRSLWGLMYIGQFFNASLPTGFAGDVVRAVEFKDGDSRAKSAGVIMLDRMIGLATMMAVVLVALAIGYPLLPPATALLLAGIAFVGLAGLIVVLQGGLLRRLSRFLPSFLSLSGEGQMARLYEALTGCSRASIVQAIGLSLVNTILTISIDFIIGRAVGIELGIGVFFIFAPIITLSLLLPTIGGLGIREVGYQFLLTPLGVPAAIAVALGLGLYVVRLTASLLGGFYYLITSSRR